MEGNLSAEEIAKKAIKVLQIFVFLQMKMLKLKNIMDNSNVTPLHPKEKTQKEEASLVSALSPREIVSELDRFVVGQNKAKKAVAVALRNRWRRQALKGEMKNEVLPKIFY